MPIRVMLVDDESLLRAMLLHFLADKTDIMVVGQAYSGNDVVPKAEECSPDIILMDINMPGVDGIQATAAVTTSLPKIKVVMLTGLPPEDRFLFGALKAGATGYVLKTDPPERIVDAIRTASEGGSWMDPRLVERVIQRYVRPARNEAPAPAPTGKPRPSADDDGARFGGLTPREREIVLLIGDGMSNHDIAEKLFISENTVKTHVSSLMRKLGLKNRLQLAIMALSARQV